MTIDTSLVAREALSVFPVKGFRPPSVSPIHQWRFLQPQLSLSRSAVWMTIDPTRVFCRGWTRISATELQRTLPTTRCCMVTEGRKGVESDGERHGMGRRSGARKAAQRFQTSEWRPRSLVARASARHASRERRRGLSVVREGGRGGGERERWLERHLVYKLKGPM